MSLALHNILIMGIMGGGGILLYAYCHIHIDELLILALHSIDMEKINILFALNTSAFEFRAHGYSRHIAPRKKPRTVLGGGGLFATLFAFFLAPCGLWSVRHFFLQFLFLRLSCISLQT